MSDDAVYNPLRQVPVTNIERLMKLPTHEERLKIIYMWVKQSHIDITQFIELIAQIQD